MKTSRLNLILSVILLLIGTLSVSYASDEVLLTATINNKSLIFDTNSLPANSTITSATLNITGSQTDNAVEPFQIMVLANGMVVGSLSSDDWENNIDNSIELDASKLSIINNQIQLQIAGSSEGIEYAAELLPDTAAVLVSYVQGSGLRSGTPRAGTVKPAIAAAGHHTVVLKSDGTVWAWGDNNSGQLGDGTKKNSTTPVQVINLTGVSAIAAGAYYTVALKSDGTVWAWGYNNSGQLGNGAITDSTTPVQVIGLTGVSAIAAISDHTVALKSDGTVWAWGSNNNGQLGMGTIPYSNTPVQVIGLTGVSAITAGFGHTVVLRTDGTVWAWGGNQYGALGNGTKEDSTTPVQAIGLTGVSAIAAGSAHTVALKADGTVWAWGDNYSGQLGDGRMEVVNTTPVQATDLTGITMVAAGSSHTVALKSDGTVWVWGNNAAGELGNGTTGISSSIPVKVINLTGTSAIAAGGAHTLVLKKDCTVWAWGNNNMGQLGDGKTSSSSTPVQSLFSVCDSVVDDCYTQAELDAKYEAGKQYCKDNPAECGISSGNGGYTQADLDAKYKEGYNAGTGSCSNDSGSSATISTALDIHIPEINYQSPFGTMKLWLDFKYVGESDGDLLWRLSDFGQK